MRNHSRRLRPGLSATLFPNKNVEPYHSKGPENVKITTLYLCRVRLFRAKFSENVTYGFFFFEVLRTCSNECLGVHIKGNSSSMLQVWVSTCSSCRPFLVNTSTINPLYNVGVGPQWFMTLKWICHCNDFLLFRPQDEQPQNKCAAISTWFAMSEFLISNLDKSTETGCRTIFPSQFFR